MSQGRPSTTGEVGEGMQTAGGAHDGYQRWLRSSKTFTILGTPRASIGISACSTRADLDSDSGIHKYMNGKRLTWPLEGCRKIYANKTAGNGVNLANQCALFYLWARPFGIAGQEARNPDSLWLVQALSLRLSPRRLFNHMTRVISSSREAGSSLEVNSSVRPGQKGGLGCRSRTV